MKMNIVEACKLAKNIEGFKTSLGRMLTYQDYGCEKTEKHLKSKAAPELEDEVVTPEDRREFDISVEDIIKLMEDLMLKKAMLSNAIENAKHSMVIDVNGVSLAYDAAIEYNKSLRSTLLYSMNSVNRIKEGTITRATRGYKMDNEGKQTPFEYDVEYTTKLTFDRAEVRKIEKKYKKLADEVSMKIDEVKISTFIDVDIDIDSTDTLEDIIGRYLESKAE